ncbi:MAG: GNAT family N-acetyltransferase [Chloroflexi bacterium]|nr:GNAT family N-acetyltransferase [Chloroflexota bacterium]
MIVERRNGEYLISSDPKKLDLEFIHQWLSTEAYWSEAIPFEVVQRLVEHSLCFGVYHESDGQVGFGRVVTDYTTFAWLTDVFIIDAYRGKGLAVSLMEVILDHPELRILRRWLLGTDHAHGLYRKFGFEDLDHPENFLTLHRSNMYTSGEYVELISKFFKR